MLRDRPAFSGFSAGDLAPEKAFYGDTLSLEVAEEFGALRLSLTGGQRVFIYPKDNHEPATYTVLNFEVADIDATVDQLAAKGVTFERYGDDFQQDAKGIARDPRGPAIAWFKDPAGNILAVLQMS